jgi:pyruvate/2-oxoglutarate dehydrogenase complex dihydrolipoamide dehydrogenase (E3) component
MDAYDVVVIGAGSGGLTAANFGAKLGARVALVEKHRVGGDCTWTGCIPSKALLHVSKLVHAARQSTQFGIDLRVDKVDMVRVRAFLDNTIRNIYQHEAPEVLAHAGIDLLLGEARFLDAHTVEVGKRPFSAASFIIATGAYPFVPNIPGLDQVPFLTYEQIFENERLPEHLIILGAGSVGVELGQAYRRLGSQVTLVDEQFLPFVEPDVRKVIAGLFADDGIEFVTGLATAVSHQPPHEITVQVGDQTIGGDMLLVATGRRPNVARLDLEKAGVAYSHDGIVVNDKLQTAVPHIFAVGDCNGGQQYTHVAGWQGFQAVRNALLPGTAVGRKKSVPWTLFTDPEVAQVGVSESEARTLHGDNVCIAQVPAARVDRAVTDQDMAGFIKLLHLPNGRLLGATIVAARAGEMISEFALAVAQGLKIRDVANVMHVYPTYSMGVQRLTTDVATRQFLGSLMGRFAARLAGLSH